MTSVSERNALALAESVARVNGRVDQIQERLEGLRATVATLIERMAGLERMVMGQKAAMTGRGPTVI